MKVGNLRILLGDTNASSRSRIKKMLLASGYQMAGEADEGMAVLRQARITKPDVAVISEDIKGLSAFQVAAVLTEDRLCPAVIVARSSSPEFIRAAKESKAAGIIPRPVQHAFLVAALEFAYENYCLLNAREREIEELRERLESRRLIERAKGILMQNLKISEEEAYRYLQKCSMNQRISMKQMAEAVIMSEGALRKR